jgi:Phospholipase_D-nuclease N-terminal
LATGRSDTLREASRINGLGAEREEPKLMNFGYNGLVGVLILAGDIWAIINIFQSSVSNEKKLLWTLVVLLLPLLGLILWFFLGPRGGRA